MKNEQPMVYCWRYEHQSICKIGITSFEKFYDNVLRQAMRFSVLDIEILGICLCDSKIERDTLEKHLLNKRFDRVRPDREFVHLNSKVWNWIQHNCPNKIWTVDFFQRLDNEYKEKHRKRSREYQRKRRRETDIKTRSGNIYREWVTVPESSLQIGGPALARVLVAEDLAAQGVEESIIQEWLDELENTC